MVRAHPPKEAAHSTIVAYQPPVMCWEVRRGSESQRVSRWVQQKQW